MNEQIGNKINDKTYIKLTPFKGFVLENFPFIEADFDAITNYQLLCKVIEYLNNVISNQNTVQELGTELVNAYNNLLSYVNNYFDNLVVQDEVNNKLDKMVEDGTLENILTNYVKIQKIYNTFEELYNDESVEVNQKVKCLGMSSINDGNGGEFIITQNEGIPLLIGLYANPLNNYQENFYNEITFVKERHYDTDCYITTIPLNDNNNNQINLYVARDDTKSPLQYAQENNTSLTINAGLSIKNTETEEFHYPLIIGNGEILHDYSMYDMSGIADNYLYIGIKENRNIKEYKVNETTSEQLLQDGCINVFNAYYKLIDNYFPADLTNVVTNEEGIVTGYHPRQVFCEMNDKSIMIFTCDGRALQSKGLTSNQIQTILIEKGVKNAWNLDGGGSTSTELKTIKLNRYFDDSYTTDRKIPYTLNVKKIQKNKNISDTYSFISKMFDLYNYKYQTERIRMHMLSGQDANNLIGELYFGFGTRMTNVPVSAGGYFINLADTITTENRWLYNKQIFIAYTSDNKRIFTRSMVNGEWTEWYDINDGIFKLYFTNDSYTIQNDNIYELIQLQNAQTISPYSNIIKLNNDGTFSFKIYTSKLLFIQCGITGPAGPIYIKVKENNNDIIFQSTYHSGTDRTQLTLVCPIIVNDINSKYSINVYGKQGNTLNLLSAYLK